MSYPNDASKQCRNLNHGRMNVPINYCPECGMRFVSKSVAPCSVEHHAGYRRQRFKFCLDCGIKLNK